MRGLTRARPEVEPAAPRQRRFAHPGWTIASGIFVALIVAAGVLVATLGRGPDAPAARHPAPASDTAAAPTTPVSAPAAAGCPELGFEDQALPQTAPAAQWRTVGRVAAPFAAAAGPVLDDDGVYRCFARTPVGALFAATNFLAAVTDPTRLQPSLEQLTAGGRGRDRLLELARTNPVAVTGSGTPYAIAGYTFLSAGLDTVAVSVVVRAGSGGMAAVPVTLVWDGDWRVTLPEDGDLTRLASPVQTLTGFTPFSAGR